LCVGRELILAAPWIWRHGQQGGKSRMRFAFLLRTLGAKCKQILNGHAQAGRASSGFAESALL
jgi:hypothetical protein